MAHKKPCAKYQYVITPSGPKILPVDEPSCKDEESPADYNAGGYLPIKVNDSFKNNRYRVVRKLGWGHFSTVWLAKDTQTQRHSALKVVKSAGRYAETARDEIKLLSKVQSFSPDHPGRCHIVSFLDSFTHQGPESSHICIVFEPLGEHLLSLIERHKKKGVPRALVRVIAKQILLGLEYLHDECDLVHTDIKPENILICIPDIESHIQCELSRSPSATSRRVGVPLPTKTRSGISIPQLQQRSRRQVQIFDSQPLVSPSRSVARSGHSLSTHPTSVTGRNSVTSSYGSPMQLVSCSVVAGKSAVGLASSAPKVSSRLSASLLKDVLDARKPEVQHEAKGKATQPDSLLPQSKTVGDSPPSSSSSSSIVSIGVSTIAGSSILSTPPTSLPQSMTGSGLSNTLASKAMNSYLGSLSHRNPRRSERQKPSLPLEFLDPKGKTQGLESDSLSSTSHTTAVAPLNTASEEDGKGHGHTRSRSGASTGFWKDPGASAPAPAVLVSANVGAAGADGDYLELSNTSVQEFPEQPNPNATSHKVTVGPKSNTLIHGVHRIITTNLLPHDSNCSTIGKHGSSSNAPAPSLLTQTAPPRHTLVQDNTSHHSSSRHPSHLSAHMHRHRSPSCKCTDPEHKHRAVADGQRRDAKSRAQPSKDIKQRVAPNSSPSKLSTVDSTSTSITPTPALPPPPVPPTTPSDEAQFVYRKFNMEPSKPGGHDSTNHEILSYVEPPPIFIKIADLGNATPSAQHYTEDIQTRQYRAPEAILGRADWDTRVDIWSVACLVFELLTAEYLFDPQGQGELFTKDDDHMAQIIELMGDFSLEMKMGGKYSRELFDHTGALRYIRALKFWPLKRVMIEKYQYSEAEANGICQFLEPMLAVDMRERACARDMKNHQWLEACEADDPVADW